MNPFLMSALRYAMTAAGAYAVARGYASSDMVDAAIGAVTAVIPPVLSALERRTTNKQLAAALAAVGDAPKL